MTKAQGLRQRRLERHARRRKARRAHLRAVTAAAVRADWRRQAAAWIWPRPGSAAPEPTGALDPIRRALLRFLGGRR